MAQTEKTQPSRLRPSPKALQKALEQSAKQAQRMADAFGLVVPSIKPKRIKMCNIDKSGYKPVPHDADFRQALLAQPGVQRAGRCYLLHSCLRLLDGG